MHVRLSLKDLLLIDVPCSSSSFLSTSRTNLSLEIGVSGKERANLVDLNVRTFDSAEGTDEVSESNRKRKGKALEVSGEIKKLKGEASLLTVVEKSWIIVGRLLLWNRTASPHPGAGLSSLDCLAFCDGASAVCCTVQSLDVELLGQYVQANSWTFVPAINHSERQFNEKDDSTGSEAGRPLKRTGCYESPKLQAFSVNERGLPHALDCGGCLEIHSLKILDELLVPTAQVFDFPSLCLSPADANARNLVLESPLEKKGKSKPRLRALGLLHCMSTPFLLPSKSSLQDAPVVSDGRFVLGQDTQKSLFNDKRSSRVQSDSQTMLGFLVELRSCCHETSWQPLRSQNAHSAWLYRCNQFLEQEVVDQGQHENVTIYFSGAAASWRPLLGAMLGDFIAITGLRRKMIQPGPEGKGFSIYVATRITLVFHVGPTLVDSCNSKVGEPVRICNQDNSNRLRKEPRGPFRHFGCLDGSCKLARSSSFRLQLQHRIVSDGEASLPSGRGLRSYVGKITGILMQDQLLELDDKVWLLLTHSKHTQLHGLRVGASVAVRHAHIMSLRSISEKVLVLGACLRSYVAVVLHSISNAGSRISPVSESRLTKYIGSLPFAWAFWALHVITSLRCKLLGVYSDTELLGSMKHAGLIRKILPSMIATSFNFRRDAFKEFLLHEHFCLLGDSSASILLSKVPPLSNFCKHVEMLWIDPVSSIWHEDHSTNNGDRESGSKMTRFCKPAVSRNSCYVRIIISGVKLGAVLIGSLKVCQSTGKLQLVDATGAFDVVVPDLRSFSNLHCVYQITEYTLVMEGEDKDASESGNEKNDTEPSPLSWSSLLKGSEISNGGRLSQSLSYFVKFSLRYAKRLEGLSLPSELQSHRSEVAVDVLCTSDLKNDADHVWKGKEFHIALITHKYPAREKISPDKDKQWAFDVEVVLLPYSLLIHQDNHACIDSLNPLFQNLDFSSCKVHGATEIRDHASAHQRNRLEKLGNTKTGTHANDSVLFLSGCLIECCVRLLVEQSSGLKKSAAQPWCTLSASLISRGCSARTSISGSLCATNEKHWATLSDSKMQKVVLAINQGAVEISQLLNSGDWCLLPNLQDKSLGFNPSEITLESKRVEIDSNEALISLQCRYAIDGQLIKADTDNFLQTVSLRRGMTSTYDPVHSSGSNTLESTDCSTESEKDILIMKMGRCSDRDTAEMSETSMSCQPQLVDAVLIVSDSLGYEFVHWLTSLKRKLIPESLNVSDALQLPSRPTRFIPNHCSNLGEICDLLNGVKLEVSSGAFSLQGDVVSIQGKLETTECSDDPIASGDGDRRELSFSRASGREHPKTTVFQLRDLRTDQLIRLDINFDKYVRPVGFGPGAVACFRRILLRRDANVLVGLPTTDVLVDSVEKRSCNFSGKCHSLPSHEQEGCAENVPVVDLLNDFISELEPRKKLLRVHCRVVSVQGLDLEWRISQSLSAGFVSADENLVKDIVIKWGCFIIDDGSAVATCWANGDQAANFLGFRELAGDLTTLCPSIIALAQNSSLPIERQSAPGASLFRLLKSLVQKHKRVCVQGEPPQGDAGTTSWLMKGVDGDLEESESTVLRFFLEQACQLGPKIVHCTTMSDEDYISKYAEEYHLKQTCFSASTTGNSRPWQHLTWNRTQLAATKVDVLNTCVELQRLVSSFDL